MRKNGILIILILCMIFCYACAGLGNTASVDRDNPKPALLTFSDDVYNALRLPSTPEDVPTDGQNIQYNIVIDSRIASSSGSSGYLKRNCYTFSQILACLKISIAGEKYNGYYTGYDIEQQFNADTQANTPVVVSDYIKTDDVFAKAAGADLSNTDILPSDAIDQIAKDVDRDSLYIFVTDMAMPNESDSYEIIEALSDEIITDNDLTVGLIGILADYAGTVYNIPISHIGVNLSDSKSYQKPIYLLYVGEKNAVFEAMDRFLVTSENNSTLKVPGNINALYYYKYNCKPNSDIQASEQQTSLVSFSGSLATYTYMKQNTINKNEIYNIISLNSDDLNKKAFLENMPFYRLYASATKDEKNQK